MLKRYQQASSSLIHVLWVLLVLYLLTAAMISLIQGGSILALLLMFAAMAAGAFCVLILGLTWLQLFVPDTFESQGGGISLLVAYIPFFVGTGILVGAWSAAFGFWLWAGHPNILLLQSIGLAGSALMGSLLPGLVALLSGSVLQKSDDKFTPLLLSALIGSFLSAAMAHHLLRWIVTTLFE